MKLSTLLPIFFVLAISLLIGQRFGFPWAGGTGFTPQVPVIISYLEGEALIERNGVSRMAQVGEVVTRGESILTEADARVLVRVRDAEIGMDQRTTLRFDALQDENLVVHLGRGRIMATSEDLLTFTTNRTESSVLKGAMSLVNYDFRETVSIIPLGTTVSVLVEPDKAFLTSQPVDIAEAPPGDITNTTFSPFSGAATDFYLWFEERTDYTFPQSTMIGLLTARF